MNSKTYIHYGSDHYDINRFTPINLSETCHIPKPLSGGFWGSPVDADFGWKDWCDREDFGKGDMDQSFKFTVKNPDKIFYICDVLGLKQFIFSYMREDRYTKKEYIRNFIDGKQFPSMLHADFEKMIRDGWKGLELNISNYHTLYYVFYSWDCDSVLIFDKDEVIEI